MARKNRWTLLVLLLAAAGSGLFCGAPSAQDPGADASSSSVVARVGDREITDEELDEQLRIRNAKAYQAYYDARRAILDDMITTMVAESEAEAKGVSIDQLMIEASGDQEVTDAEIDSFYEQNKNRMGGRTLEQMRDQIRTHLVTTKGREDRLAYVEELKRKAGVKILIEPPRMEVKIAAHDPSMGSEEAPILLVVYSDFQ
jgi:hypothetical protein